MQAHEEVVNLQDQLRENQQQLDEKKKSILEKAEAENTTNAVPTHILEPTPKRYVTAYNVKGELIVKQRREHEVAREQAAMEVAQFKATPDTATTEKIEKWKDYAQVFTFAGWVCQDIFF